MQKHSIFEIMPKSLHHLMRQ